MSTKKNFVEEIIIGSWSQGHTVFEDVENSAKLIEAVHVVLDWLKFDTTKPDLNYFLFRCFPLITYLLEFKSYFIDRDKLHMSPIIF